MLLERSFIAIEQGNSRFSLRNSRIPHYVIPQLDWGSLTIGILKFRHCEALKKREQSLGILVFILGILVFWGLGGVFEAKSKIP